MSARYFWMMTLIFLIHLVGFAHGDVLSFQDWKSEKITKGRQQYSTLENQYLTKKKYHPQDRNLNALYKELRDSKLQLNEFQDLNVTDYFISYLSQFKDKKSIFQMALSKLEAQEVSELMTAYANSLLKTSGEGLSHSAEVEPLEANK